MVNKLFYNLPTFAETSLLNSIRDQTLVKDATLLTRREKVETRVFQALVPFSIYCALTWIDSIKERYFEITWRIIAFFNIDSINVQIEPSTSRFEGLKLEAWASKFLTISHECKQSWSLLSTLATVWQLCHRDSLLVPQTEESRGTSSGDWP